MSNYGSDPDPDVLKMLQVIWGGNFLANESSQGDQFTISSDRAVFKFCNPQRNANLKFLVDPNDL